MKWFPVVALLSLLLLSSMAWGTEEYGRQTGKACSVCHVDPAGGGALTPDGISFANDLGKAVGEPSSIHRLFRFLAGFVHLFIAILWFGTILYVHLVLKPAYAARGLPKGEMFVGLSSMVLIAISGAILTVYRVPSLDILLHSRFGILLLAKVSLYLVMVSTAVVAVLFIGPKMRRKKDVALAVGEQDLTLSELMQFDGRAGRPAYVAYKGIIYNVTAGRLWKEGTHAGRHNAGADLTDFIKQAPHDEEKITAMPVVGRLVASVPVAKPLHERVFYFFAYMNLVIVIAIIFIISLWRWS